MSTGHAIAAEIMVGLCVLVAIIGAFHECDRRGRERHELQLIWQNKCQGTPEQAEKLFPYPGQAGP